MKPEFSPADLKHGRNLRRAEFGPPEWSVAPDRPVGPGEHVMPAGNPAPSRAHRELALSLRRRKDRPRFGSLHDRRLSELGFAGGHREYRRLTPPMAEKDHFQHDILVRQRAPGVLAVPDCDFDRSRSVTREPHVRPGRWRDARSDRDRAGRKPDARTAPAPVAAA